MKKFLALLLAISTITVFGSCNKTPDGSYLNEVSVKIETDTENTHLNSTEKHITASYTQGELTLGIDADVTAPKAQKIYKRKSDYFDFSDKNFQKLAAKALLGKDYKKKASSFEGQFVYQSEIGELSIEPEKDICQFISNTAESLDCSEENFIEDVSLDHEYALTAKEIAAKLGFNQYEPYYCERYGKSDPDNEFYLIILNRKTDNIYVQNTITQSMAQDNVPPAEKIEISIADGQLWSVRIRAASIDEESKTETAVIPLTSALDVLKNSGIGALSQNIAMNGKTEIAEISLSYIHTPDGEKYKLIPAWVFLVKNESTFKWEALIDYSYFVIDAETAKIL